MTISKLLSASALVCATAAVSACSFSAGVADLATQQNRLREAAAPALNAGRACILNWQRQRDASIAATTQGQGDRASVITLVNTAKTSCDAAATAWGGLEIPAVINPENQALLRTAQTACQGTYTAISAQLQAKSALLSSSQTDWSSPVTDQAVMAAMASSTNCDQAFRSALTAMQMTDLEVSVLVQNAPAAGTAAPAATAVSPSPAGDATAAAPAPDAAPTVGESSDVGSEPEAASEGEASEPSGEQGEGSK